MSGPSILGADGRPLVRNAPVHTPRPADPPPAWWGAWREAVRAGGLRPGLSAELRAEAARAAGFSVRA
jgi:hypothetical protein